MSFFGRKTAESSGIDKRREKLMGIKKMIESEIELQQVGLHETSGVGRLRKLMGLQSLWVADSDEIIKFGDVDYSEELKEFEKLKKKFPDLVVMQFQRNGMRYYMVQKSDKSYIFSTPIEITGAEMAILLEELRKMPGQMASATTV